MFPKANNVGQILPNLTAYLQYFSISGSFHFLLPLPSRSLNPQTSPISPLLRVCFSLSTSLYIHFSPDPQHHLVDTQKSTIPLSVNKVTVHQISKGILWPVSVIHCFKKSSSLSPQSCQKSSYRRETFKKCDTLKSSKRFLFEY